MPSCIHFLSSEPLPTMTTVGNFIFLPVAVHEMKGNGGALSKGNTVDTVGFLIKKDKAIY